MKLSAGQRIRWVRLLLHGVFSSFENDTALAILEKTNMPNPVIFDIGANVGLFAKAFAKSDFRPAEIWCFEPSGYLFGILNRVVKKYDAVRVFKLALSDSNGIAELNMPVKPSGSIRVGLSHIGKKTDGKYLTERVETARLDDFMAQHNINGVDIVKMDIEGAEGLALKGAKKLLDEIRPNWFVEVSDRAGRFSLDGGYVLRAFADAGYVAYRRTQQGAWQKQDNPEPGHDYLFIPKEKADP